MSELDKITAMTARYSPVDISVDITQLPVSERKTLAKLVQVGNIMDALFFRQIWAENETMLLDLLKDETQLGRARVHYFLINKGPWSRLDQNEIFIPGAPVKPAGANFYPPDTSKEEIEAWLRKLPESERTGAMGFFTAIRHAASGKGAGFVVVPYSMEYQPELVSAARLLREAAALTNQPSLKAYLTKRADAFLSNDYYDSDLAWMELDSSIEPTIGPYEVYEDEWFNAKAAFEAFVTVRDEAETAKLAKLAAHLQDVENNLPVDPKYRNPKIGAMAPIRVVNEILASGDGIRTSAFNLPNDERINREKGAKRVMLKNVQEAKFKIVLAPIARTALAAEDQKRISFDAFFTFIVTHELMHGLGPHDIVVGGRNTTVRQELRETYSAIEEAKADISGMFAFQMMIDKGILDANLKNSMYETFLASAFRSIRLGISEAHGRANAIQLNYLLDCGAVKVDGSGVFSVSKEKIGEGVKALARDLLTLEAEGNYAKAKDLITRLGIIRPEVQKALDKLKNVPVDIEPKYTTAESLLR